jgi:ankyrin repeat protein
MSDIKSETHIHNLAFQMACHYGYANIVKLLIKKGKLTFEDLSEFNFVAFRKACEFGHVKVLRVLLTTFQLKREDVCYNDNEPFRTICQTGYGKKDSKNCLICSK